MSRLTWEQAVLSLRSDPQRQALVRDAYYDDPVLDAARRFADSEEFAATLSLLGQWLPGVALEIGAGRGIASYAFARVGSKIYALEPDPSPIVGRGAIEELAAVQSGIIPLAGTAEQIPLPDSSVDVVYGRAVFHHAADLARLGQEVGRVLRPGGVALFAREHVIRGPRELPAFLARHPLHHLYGGEAAYQVREYKQALEGGGLDVVRAFGPFESVINYYPASPEALWPGRLGLIRRSAARVPYLAQGLDRLRSLLDRTPGRHYTFLAVRRNQATAA